MIAFDKDKFEHDANEQAMTDIDKIVRDLKMDLSFAAFPDVLEGYRRMLTVAWMNGAGWGLERGMKEQSRLGLDAIEAIRKARRDA